MQFRLPETYGDAKEVLTNALDKKVFMKGLYGTIKSNPCEVVHIQIHDKKELEDIGSIVVDLNYKERVINKYGKFEEKKVVQTLHILNPRGDEVWPFTLVVKIWDVKYPSSIALDIKRGIVYFLNINSNGLSLVEFAHLNEEEIEAISYDLNEREPYKIRLDERAMFDFIAEYEGIKALKRGVFIEFDCGVRFRVYNNLCEE